MKVFRGQFPSRRWRLGGCILQAARDFICAGSGSDLFLVPKDLYTFARLTLEQRSDCEIVTPLFVYRERELAFENIQAEARYLNRRKVSAALWGAKINEQGLCTTEGGRLDLHLEESVRIDDDDLPLVGLFVAIREEGRRVVKLPADKVAAAVQRERLDWLMND